MNETLIFVNISEYNKTTNDQNIKFQIYSGILSAISIIPNFITIIIFVFQKGKLNLQQRIQLILCFSFIGIEIRFIPIKSNNHYYFFQACISFSSIIIATYYQFIYSFIAYKLFTSPKDLLTKCNIFFIYFFPFILFLFLSCFIYLFSNLTLYFGFIAYPENPEKGITNQLSKRVSHVFRIIFFLLNFLFIIKLLKKINQVIKGANNIDNNFTNKKFYVYKNKLIWYIVGMIIVMHPYLLRFPVEYFNNLDTGEALQNYNFSIYFHGVESLSGLVYWIIYIYNKLLIRRFMIIFCFKKEEEYTNEFIEEKIIHEQSAEEIISERNPNLISLFSIDNNENGVESRFSLEKPDKEENYIDDEDL